MKQLIFGTLILIFGISGGCRTNAPSNETALTVSAAISLKDAFTEIKQQYQSQTGDAVNFNFGASGALQRQIENGAPVDVFASAGAAQMDELAAKNLIDADSRRDFAQNELVLIVPSDSTLNLTNFSGLSDARIQKIAVGNPQSVPAGQYAAQVLAKNNLTNVVQSKLILAEDVRQVLDYVARGEVDAGIIYVSDALIANGKVRVAATATATDHDPLRYPIALLKDGAQKPNAEEFVKFVLSADGQNILRKYGFSGAAEK